MSFRTNLRPSPCATCRAPVAANQGTLMGPPWKVICQVCVPFPTVASAATIAITLAGADKIEATPSDKLGSGLWATYKATLDRVGVRARKDAGGAWHSYGPLACASELVKALGDAGFALNVAAEVTEAVAAAGRVAGAAVAQASVRIEAVDAELAKRGKALYPFQREGVTWLAPRPASLLADDMGLGKTIQVLAAIPAGAPVLVVCPAVAKGVWMREAKAWRPDLTPVKVDGRGKFRWPAAGELIIMNDEILPAVEIATGEVDADGEKKMAPAPFLASCPAGLVVIHDECHRGKNFKAQRTQRVRAISKAARAAGGRNFGISGTPLMNHAPDLWSVLQNLGLANEAFGSWFGFARAMGGTQEEVPVRGGGGKKQKVWVWGGRPTPAATDALKRVMLRRTKDEVLPDLPAKTYKAIDVEIEDQELLDQLELLQESVDAAGGWGEYFEHGAAEDKKFAIAFSDISRTRARLAAAKLNAAIAVIEEYEDAGEPLVVFSAHRDPVIAIGNRPGWRAIVGGMAAAERTKIEEDFQAGRLKGVALTIGAGGVAITLTRASNAIFLDRSWTPAENQQAEDRIRRIGTTKAVLITDLIADHPLDQQVTEMLIAKQSVIDASVESARIKAGEHAGNAAATAESAAEVIARQDEIRRQALLARAERARLLREALAKLEAEQVVERERAERERLDPKAALERCVTRASGRIREQSGESPARGPLTEREVWAVQALASLAAADIDYAQEENGVGFSKAHTGIGHALARAAAAGELSDWGWSTAITVAMRYPRQVGQAPGGAAEAE